MDDFQKHKKQLMQNPEFRRKYEESRVEYEIAFAIIRARIKHKLTQAQLAQKMKTRQSVISRVESGNATPSISFLKRLAAVLGGSLDVQFRF